MLAYPVTTVRPIPTAENYAVPTNKGRPAAAAVMVAVLAAFAADPPPEKGTPKAVPDKRIAALETKLHGTWIGRGMFASLLTFKADGTFERSATIKGTEGEGTWELRWDALPPTLVMKFSKSVVEGEASKTQELKVTGLDDGSLRFEAPDSLPHQSIGYRRVKK
jgi:hypothetical protein